MRNSEFAGTGHSRRSSRAKPVSRPSRGRLTKLVHLVSIRPSDYSTGAHPTITIQPLIFLNRKRETPIATTDMTR